MNRKKILETLICPDERNLSFGGLTLESLSESLEPEPSELPRSIPKEVKDHLSITRLLALYGWFQYEFYTVSVTWSVLCIERALKISTVQ